MNKGKGPWERPSLCHNQTIHNVMCFIICDIILFHLLLPKLCVCVHVWGQLKITIHEALQVSELLPFYMGTFWACIVSMYYVLLPHVRDAILFHPLHTFICSQEHFRSGLSWLVHILMTVCIVGQHDRPLEVRSNHQDRPLVGGYSTQQIGVMSWLTAEICSWLSRRLYGQKLICHCLWTTT